MKTPYANAHVHANCMATNDDVLRLIKSKPIGLGNYKYIDPSTGRRTWPPGDFEAFHAANAETVSLIRRPEDLRAIVSRSLRRDAEAGCLSVRLLSSALNNCPRHATQAEINGTFEANMTALADAATEAREKTGIETFITVSAKRHLEPERALHLLAACEAFQNRHPAEAARITGFDIAGDETRRSLDEFQPAAERAVKLGLRISVHAGETEARGADDIRAAMRLAGIEVISHALALQDDSELAREVKARGILVERLLVSNRMLHPRRFGRWHPVGADFAAGFRMALGSDDPGLQPPDPGQSRDHGTTIGDEYRTAQACHAFAPADLLQFTVNAIRHSFMPKGVQTKLLKRVRDYASAECVALPPEVFHPVPRSPWALAS